MMMMILARSTSFPAPNSILTILTGELNYCPEKRSLSFCKLFLKRAESILASELNSTQELSSFGARQNPLARSHIKGHCFIVVIVCEQLSGRSADWPKTSQPFRFGHYGNENAMRKPTKLSPSTQADQLTNISIPFRNNIQQNPTATTKGRSLVSNNGLAGLNGSKIDPLGVRPRTSFGRVQLDISYFAKSGSLTVHVIQCLQLLGMAKRRTTSNP